MTCRGATKCFFSERAQQNIEKTLFIHIFEMPASPNGQQAYSPQVNGSFKTEQTKSCTSFNMFKRHL